MITLKDNYISSCFRQGLEGTVNSWNASLKEVSDAGNISIIL